MVKRSPKTRSRPFRSLRVSDSFRAFALDQLSSVDDLIAKPMFGGFGLYAGDVFFGILAADVLYFKVDDSNRVDYQKVKAQPFSPFADGRMSMSYYARTREHSRNLAHTRQVGPAFHHRCALE
jgi:TfoX/Sxy family transcriptional regulator of competence genes